MSATKNIYSFVFTYIHLFVHSFIPKKNRQGKLLKDERRILLLTNIAEQIPSEDSARTLKDIEFRRLRGRPMDVDDGTDNSFV